MARKPHVEQWMTCCLLLICRIGLPLVSGAEESSTVRFDAMAPLRSEILTNVGQLRALPSRDYLRGCPIRLTGTVTLVDTNRRMLVVQDATGAVAINPDTNLIGLASGQLVGLESGKASPYYVSLRDYPYRPSGWDIRSSFEAPANWGDYHLTRMRGYLHPPVTGEYTFWIASDDSSELWLSDSSDPAKVKRIGFVAQGSWVDPREWSRYASQRSEGIFLRAGQSYYVEAFQEQLLQDDHLAVAWRGPGLAQSVISGVFLTPWIESREQMSLAETNGILREYWTNYSVGMVSGLTGPRPFESALSVKGLRVTVLGLADLPEPRRIRIDQPLPPEDNFRWVETEGAIGFMGQDGSSASLELVDGEGWTQLRVLQWGGNSSYRAQDWLRVQGVCEAVPTIRGSSMPGLIWVPSPQNLCLVERTNAAWISLATVPADRLASASSNAALGGYFFSRGIVTFNDCVWGKDCLYIQENAAGIFVSQVDRKLKNQLQVGQLVELGGQLLADKYAPGVSPRVFSVLGWRQLPEPETQPIDPPLSPARDGRWTEVEGVVRTVNPDGTMLLMCKRSPVRVWVGQTPGNVLASYVDSGLRVRGVLSLATFEKPVLLVPSRTQVELKEESPADPFLLGSRTAASLAVSPPDPQRVHRIKMGGVVTFRNEKSMFVEDDSGSVRVETTGGSSALVGDSVEVVGFPDAGRSLPVLTEALVHRRGTGRALTPLNGELADLFAGRHNGCLVRVKATLLAQRTGDSQVLELQDGQHIFQAALATHRNTLPSLAPGSLLDITGVCEAELAMAPRLGDTDTQNPALASVRIYLRSPADVLLISGPPWWTWKRAAMLVGALLAVLLGSLLWIHLLRRRLERQQAARLAFSRQILEGQESERRRIAANLHDSLGQNLLVIKNQARLAMQSTTDETLLEQRLDAISAVASQAIEEVRQITHDLRPYQLDRLGLTLAIRAVINRVSENSPILFASHVDEVDGLFDKESEIHLYRIVQEGLNNVVKHSCATEAAVVIKKHDQLVSLSIRDNGRGFEATLSDGAGQREAGFGLSGIRERSRILGGNLALDSRAGQGTTLTCEFPLSQFHPEKRS